MTTNIRNYFLKVIVFILVCSYLMDKMAFVLLNSISDKVYSGQSIGKLNQFLEIKDDLDFIVVGSSRANHHVDVEKIAQKSFNMGSDGTKMAYASTLIKTLPNKEQVILMHISPQTAFSKTYSGEDVESLKSKYNRNVSIENEINYLKKNNPFQQFYWSLGYTGSILGMIKNRFFPNYDHTTYKGYDPLTVSEGQKKTLETILNRNITKPCQEDLVLNPVYAHYLKDLKIFCKKNKKKLILFTAPIYDDTCKSDNQKLAAILQKSRIQYYDYADFFRNNNSIDYWKDQTHLSETGAQLLTTELKEKLNLELK
tara:strand:+ start:12959 stop:13894 length:936 start_codon:yes stop_codon:yes gene_type:complete